MYVLYFMASGKYGMELIWMDFIFKGMELIKNMEWMECN